MANKEDRIKVKHSSFLVALVAKNSVWQMQKPADEGSDSGLEILRRKWQPVPLFLPPGKLRQRSLAGYAQTGLKNRHDWVPTTAHTPPYVPAMHYHLSPRNEYLCSYKISACLYASSTIGQTETIQMFQQNGCKFQHHFPRIGFSTEKEYANSSQQTGQNPEENGAGKSCLKGWSRLPITYILAPERESMAEE